MQRIRPLRRRAYDTDFSYGQWALIELMIPKVEPGGRPRKGRAWELMDAILHFLRAGGGWRLLPHDLPPRQMVYYYLRRWQWEGVWNRVHHALVMADRERVGRELPFGAAVLDSQSVRTAEQNGARRASTRAGRSPGGLSQKLHEAKLDGVASGWASATS